MLTRAIITRILKRPSFLADVEILFKLRLPTTIKTFRKHHINMKISISGSFRYRVTPLTLQFLKDDLVTLNKHFSNKDVLYVLLISIFSELLFCKAFICITTFKHEYLGWQSCLQICISTSQNLFQCWKTCSSRKV